MIDYTLTTAEAWVALGQCLSAFGVGFFLGVKLKLVRKIEEMV